jgi:hypothetical protein
MLEKSRSADGGARGHAGYGAQRRRQWVTEGYADAPVRYAAPMGFGKNPHVAKAQAAEQKAQSATDEAARTLAWREAARQWDRAAEREQRSGGAARGQSYLDKAEAARIAADSDPNAAADAEPDTAQEGPSESAPDSADARLLN